MIEFLTKDINAAIQTIKKINKTQIITILLEKDGITFVTKSDKYLRYRIKSVNKSKINSDISAISINFSIFESLSKLKTKSIIIDVDKKYNKSIKVISGKTILWLNYNQAEDYNEPIIKYTSKSKLDVKLLSNLLSSSKFTIIYNSDEIVGVPVSLINKDKFYLWFADGAHCCRFMSKKVSNTPFEISTLFDHINPIISSVDDEEILMQASENLIKFECSIFTAIIPTIQMGLIEISKAKSTLKKFKDNLKYKITVDSQVLKEIPESLNIISESCDIAVFKITGKSLDVNIQSKFGKGSHSIAIESNIKQTLILKIPFVYFSSIIDLCKNCKTINFLVGESHLYILSGKTKDYSISCIGPVVSGD